MSTLPPRPVDAFLAVQRAALPALLLCGRSLAEEDRSDRENTKPGTFLHVMSVDGRTGDRSGATAPAGRLRAITSIDPAFFCFIGGQNDQQPMYYAHICMYHEST